MESGGAAPTYAPRRLVAYFVVLGLVAAAIAAVVFGAGSGEHAEREIAGGYDVTRANSCLGPVGAMFDLEQSGRFVTVASGGGPSGKLELRDGRLTGTLECARGGTGAVTGRAAGGALAGAVGGEPATAALRREPPAPGVQRPRAPRSVDGEYALAPRSACLGAAISLDGNRLKAGEREAGRFAYGDGKLRGRVRCDGGAGAALAGQAAGRQIMLTVGAEKLSAAKQRAFESTLGAFFLAVAVVMLAARLTGALFQRIGQPRVMGEVTAGILLGPTFLGKIAPDLQQALFPSDVIPYIGVAANLGLIFYMFLVGLELDLSQLKGRLAQAVAISNTGVLVPMAAGLLIALPVYELVGPDTPFAGFALFMGVSMSITAFPVLARILVERRMLKRPIGALALASAAIDDVTAWFLIALATAVAVAGTAAGALETVALAVAFVAVMFLGARRLLARASVAYDEAGRVPGAWIAAIFAGVLVSAFVTEEIGIAVIFGAFVMGAVMPRHAGLTEDVTHRVEDFVVTLLLPLFFAYTGLKTNLFLLDRWQLVVLAVVLLVVAIACKFGGTVLAARVTRLSWRESAVLGALMNTRGLTELIVLNLALEKGVMTEALFAALVIMALATTFMTGPLLSLFDPRNELGAPLEEELEEARRASAAQAVGMLVPERSILVAPQAPAATDQLVALAEPLASSTPPRELILVRVLRPPRAAQVRGALQTEDRALTEASADLARRRLALLEHRIAARAVVFNSAHPGHDVARLAESEEVDLVLVDGRRPLLGGGVPRGEVGTILARAPSDVGVLVAREGAAVVPGPDAPVLVPFGGADHDWAALELAAWMSSATTAPLRLLGAAGTTGEGRDATRLLANASLLVQQFAGVHAEPVVAPGGPEIVAAAAGAGLLVVGLSDRWREEGLGDTRAAIARAAPAPILFVRRGRRTGALAPRDDVTRFSWSSPLLAGR